MCDAYIEKGGALVARGAGRRHRRCKRPATTERTREEGQFTGPPLKRIYKLCGQHARQWDKAADPDAPFANPPNLRSDW